MKRDITSQSYKFGFITELNQMTNGKLTGDDDGRKKFGAEEEKKAGGLIAWNRLNTGRIRTFGFSHMDGKQSSKESTRSCVFVVTT